MRKLASILIICLLVISCGRWDKSAEDDNCPPIFPDYTDIAIPCNIAPLNFMLEGATRMKVTISAGDEEYSFSSMGGKMKFPLRRWKAMLGCLKGSTAEVKVTAQKDGKAVAYKSFTWEIRSEAIDKYLSYRLIEPAYEVWNVLSIEERCTENFKERSLARNSVTGHSCMNCHTSNRADIPTTFLHARSKGGATLYQREGHIRKIDTSSDSTAGPAVYGEISKDGRYGIFTTADIRNGLHSAALERFEVFDSTSDLVLIDFNDNTITDSPLVKGSEFQETFPCWSADDRKIYFCRSTSLEQPMNTKNMHYDLYSIDFDPVTGRLGDTLIKVFDAAATGKSVSFPKCSPDGKKILFTVSDYGTFPIWHIETDLWMIDIESGETDRMEDTNGEYSDSYHCWSSSGRWICWASKRYDRVYGRPYFAFVREDGSTTKGFVLPQKDPGHYLMTFKSYNIPELYNQSEPYGAWYMRKFYKKMKTEHLQYIR